MMFRSNRVQILRRDDVGTLSQHIEFSGSLYSVANNAGKVDSNYEL